MTAGTGGRRRAGLLIPLFSAVSTASWGVGDIADLAPLTAWLAAAGQRILQLLPLNEMAPGQKSPYSAISAMAIDPIFISLPMVAEFVEIGGESALPPADRQLLDRVRQSSRIDYAGVRQLKGHALASSFARFLEAEWSRDTDRARRFQEFLASEAWWVRDYTLFRALHRREGERPWPEWAPALRNRERAALDAARAELAHEVLFFGYLQWLAWSQWKAARVAAAANCVELFGDLPFMVDGDSADVWVRQGQFRLDASLGVPPDAFSATGQDWGMPPYRWEAVAADDFGWLRERARRSADLYDGYRVDHLVGFYRTFARPHDGSEPFFAPAVESEQTALGERVLGVLREADAEIIAEDLGTIPDFVRRSLAGLAVPGFRVFRWEREWNTEGQPFRDPAAYPAVSVAASGTHDTESVAVWWETASDAERQAVNDVPMIQEIGGRPLGPAFDPTVRDVLLEVLFASGSEIVILPIQDVFGWRDRINTPALVDDQNWTFRLPWAVDRLDEESEPRERRATLRAWATRYGR